MDKPKAQSAVSALLLTVFFTNQPKETPTQSIYNWQPLDIKLRNKMVVCWFLWSDKIVSSSWPPSSLWLSSRIPGHRSLWRHRRTAENSYLVMNTGPNMLPLVVQLYQGQSSVLFHGKKASINYPSPLFDWKTSGMYLAWNATMEPWSHQGCLHMKMIGSGQ